MTTKRRHQTIDLGLVAADTWSSEIDMTSFTHATMFVPWPENNIATIQVFVQASPTPHGTAADWYDVHNANALTTTFAVAPFRVIMEGTSAPNIPDQRNRALPIGVTRNPVSGVVAAGAVYGETPLPRRLRLKPSQSVSITVQTSREIG